VNEDGQKWRPLVGIMMFNFLDRSFPPAIVYLASDAVSILPIMLITLGSAFVNVVENKKIHDIVHVMISEKDGN